MDNFLHRQDSDVQQKRGFLIDSHIFDSILPLIRQSLNWLAGFFQLTEEEQENAGVYLGRLGDQ
jgi:hypothetical protein